METPGSTGQPRADEPPPHGPLAGPDIAPAGDRAEAPQRQVMDDRERTLHPRIVIIWRAIGLLIVPFVVLPPLVFVTVVWGLLAMLGATVILVLAAVIAVGYPRLKYRAWSWRLTPIALELRHGVVVRRHQAIPYFRIQQIDIAQGPLDRAAELATLQVTTASSSGGGALPGIAADDAPEIRAELLTRAAAAVGEQLDDLSDAV